MVTVPLLAQAQLLPLGIRKGSGAAPLRLGIAEDPTTISGIAQDGAAVAGTAESVGRALLRKVAWECFETNFLCRFEFFPARGLFVDTRGLRPKQEASSE